jgi:hypothetical protein
MCASHIAGPAGCYSRDCSGLVRKLVSAPDDVQVGHEQQVGRDRVPARPDIQHIQRRRLPEMPAPGEISARSAQAQQR